MRRALPLSFAALALAAAGVHAATIMDNQPMLYWDFNNVVLGDGTTPTHFPDLVEELPLFEVGLGSFPTTNPLDGSQAIDFSGGDTSFANSATGKTEFIGPWAMEIDFKLPDVLDYQYIAGCGPNKQHLLWGLGDDQTQIRMFGSPYALGPSGLNDGQWHKLVVANYGNASGTEGYVNKLVYSVDGGALQSWTLNPEGAGNDRCALGLSYITAGAADNNLEPFSGSLDNLAMYNLARSISDWEGDLEAQFDAAVTAIATGQQRLIADVEPPTPPSTPLTNYGWKVLKDNPSYYWSFNEAEITDPAQELVRHRASDDLKPMGNATRTAAVNANLGQAAQFDGNASHFSAVQMSGGDMPGAWAVEFWVYMDDANPYSYLVNFGNPDNHPAVYKMNGKIIPFSLNGQPAEENRPAATPGEWQHVVVSYYGDGTMGVANRMDVALNGVVSTIDDGSFSTVLNMARTVVGAALPSGIDAFTGKIDEVATYDLSGMTEAQIAIKTADLAAHYAAASETAETSLAFVDPAEITYTYNDAPWGQDGSHPFGDGGLTKLTDGTFMSTDLAVSAVFGQNKGGEVVFDLGSARTLDAILIDYVATASAYGSGAPGSISFAFSSDGVTYGTPQDYTPMGGDAVNRWVNQRMVADLGGVDAQFVKMTLTHTLEWTPLDEVWFVEDLGGSTPTLPGDLNADGSVNSADLDLVRGNWGQIVAPNSSGDATGDGFVNSADLDVVRANWGATAAAAVPEPSFFILLAVLAGYGLLARRR